MMGRNRFVVHSSVAMMALGSIYFVVVGLVQSFTHAVEQLASLWYLMIPLMAGFGLQVGLFSHLRRGLKSAQASAMTSGSGAVSTVSMIACCAHHLTDLLPVIGLGAVSLILSQYFVFFIGLGIMSNLIWISVILVTIQRSELYPRAGFLGRIFSHDMKKFRNLIIVSTLIVLPVALFAINSSPVQGQIDNTKPLVLPTLTNSEGGLTFSVKPIDFSFQEEVSFEIKMDTHINSLDFDLTRISYLTDDGSMIYQPISWVGPSGDSHHREGILRFPPISVSSRYMRLTIENAYGVPRREFNWTLGL